MGTRTLPFARGSTVDALIVLVGLLCAGIFGSVFVGGIRTLNSPGLALTDEALTLQSHSFAKADIAGFREWDPASSARLTCPATALRPMADHCTRS